MTDYNLDELGAKVAQLEQMMTRLALADQLSSTTIGGEDAVDVGDALDTAADASTAIPQLQDDVDEYGEAVNDLGENIAAVMVDLDARLDAGAASLELAREEIEEAQAEVDAAFGQRMDGMSQDIDRAITSADGKALILFSTSDPSGTAPTGSTWFRIDTVQNVAGQWQQTGTVASPVWTPRLINSEVVANLDVAKLTAGNAAIATLVAQKIAASTASFQTVNVANLFVTSGATMQQAVIDYLFANVVQAKKITADMIDVNSLNGVTLTGTTVRTASSGQRVVLSGGSGGTNDIRFYGPPINGADNLQVAIKPSPTTEGGLMINGGPDDFLPALYLGRTRRHSAGGTNANATVNVSASTIEAPTMMAGVVTDYDTAQVLVDDSGWVNLSIASAYSGSRTPSVRRLGQTVWLSGQITRNSGNMSTSDTNMFTLPAQFRPLRDVVTSSGLATGGFAARIRISASTGVVGIDGLPSGYSANYVTLDPISYPVSYKLPL